MNENENEIPAPDPGPKLKRILLVEDEPMARLQLLEALRRSGLEVEVAANGRIALEKFQSSPPDAIFMDLLLPALKGVDLIKEARRNPAFGDRPIYVCTSAVRLTAWAQRGTKAGATKVFDRAVTPVDVIAAQLAAELGVTTPAVQNPSPSATASSSAACQPGSKSGDRRSSETEAAPVAGVGGRAPLIKRVFQSFRKPKPVEQAQTSSTIPTQNPQNSPPVKETPGPAAPAGFVPASSVSATRPPVIAPTSYRASTLDSQQPAGLVADQAAIVCFNESGIIVSANGCQEVFGWEGAALVGQSLSTLVKEGTDREVMEFIQQRLQGNSGDGSQSLSVIARRKDGTEFCASVRTVIWSTETNFTYKSDTARLSWTAVFRPELSYEIPAPAIEQPAYFDETEASEPIPGGTVDSVQNQTADAELRAAYEEIRRQFDSVSAEALTLREVQARQCQDSEELVRRINGLESELTQARKALEQERSERGKIHAKSEELAGALMSAQKNSKQQNAADQQAAQKAVQLARDLEETKGSLGRTEEALKDRAATCEKLEAELRVLRQQVLTLSCRTTPPAPNQRSEESRPPREQSESEDGSRLAHPEANRDPGLHRDLEAELSAAKAAAQVAEACMREEVQRAQSFEQRLNLLCTNLKQEQSERGKRFEEELTRHRTERETLKQQLATAEATAETTRRQAEDLEKRLTDNSADLIRVSAELENRTNEHQRSEVELRKQLETAEAQSKKLKEALRQAETRATTLQQELGALQQGRADLSARLATEQQAAAEIQFRVGDLEERLRQNSAELERVKTERDCAMGQKSSEMDMANLYHMRDLLASKLEIEQRVAAESTNRAQALEEQLRNNSAELERVKKALDKNSREKTQLENKLQTQLNAAKAAAAEAEANLKQKLGECGRLQKDLGNLQQARDDLRVQLKLAQQAAVDASEKNEQFEQKLRERAAELEQVKAEQLRQAEEQKRIEAELQAQLLSAKAATERAEASCHEEAERNRTFEQRLLTLGNTLKREEMERTRRMQEELDIVRRTCEELTQKNTAAQKATDDGQRQLEQLNQQLRATNQQLQASAEELQRLKADQASRTQEHSRIQSDLNAQLQASKTSIENTAAALKEKTDAFSQLQSELQKTRTEFGSQVTTAKQETAEARKQAQELTQQFQAAKQELERLKADQSRHTQEQTRTQSELQAQLQASKAAAEKAETVLKQKNEVCGQLQSELQKARTELGGQLTTAKQETAEARKKTQELAHQLQASQDELNRLKADQNKHAQEQTRAQSDLTHQLQAARQEADRLKADQSRHTQDQTRAQSELQGQLQATKAALEKAEAALKQKNEAYGQLQGELQKTRSELSGQLTTSKRDSTDSRKHVQELTQQLQAAKKCAEKAEASLKEKSEQLAQVEAELTKHQQALAKTKRQGKDLEKQQVDHASEIAKLEATIDEHKAARQKLEAQLRERENEASTRAGLESENQSLAEARATLSAELCLLREGHVSLEAQLAESHRQVQESVSRIDRATADLEKERGERRRAENRVDSLTGQLQELHGQIKAHLDAEAAVHGRIAELEKHLRESEDHVTRVNDDLQKERTDRQLLEQQLKTADVLSGQLRNCLTSFDVAKEGFKRAQVQLETKLKTTQEALKESDAKLQKEIADRLRQEEALAQARQAVQAHSQGSAAELAKLTAELEEERLERKRIEGNIVQSRYASFDSARAGLSMVNRLRTQVREPIDGLMQSTRLLLEAELEDEHRKLVETVLEKAVLLQRTLQEAGTLGACSTRPDNASPSDSDHARSGDPTSAPSSGKQP